MARPAPETKKRTVPGLRLARGVRMKVELTKEWCMNMAKHEGAAGDPDCSAGAAVAPLRAAAQVVALEPEGPDGHGVNWLAGKRPKPGDLLYGGDAVARALAAKNEAETNALKAVQEADELRAALAAETRRWEEAMRMTWQMVDPLKPAGTPGSYARGQDSGIVAALTTLRANLKPPNVRANRPEPTRSNDE